MNLVRELDRILRGEATRIENLRDGEIRIPVVGICTAIFILGFVYGFCMSFFSIVNRDGFEWPMLVAPVVKVPLLFMLTLLVTFPSLYVFNALVGSRLSLLSLFRLIIASLAVMLMVLASFGPITSFFSFSTESYSFMILLNVVLFAIAGILGLMFLLQTLHRLTVAPIVEELRRTAPPPATDTSETPSDEGIPMAPPQREPSSIDALPSHPMSSKVKAVVRIWIVIFGFVGAQMAWLMRPFVGAPGMEFTWFRPRGGNFFEAVWNNLVHFLN